MGRALRPPPRLLDRVRNELRTRHYSYRTEKSYVGWIRRFILFHDKRHPREMGAEEVVTFLTHLAVEGEVSAKTQNQALSAILFLYRVVLRRELEGLDQAVRARESRRLPVVLSRDDVRRLLGQLSGTHRIMATLLYGSGLRLRECLSLRVRDFDFERHQLIVRQGKGGGDRAALLPRSVVEPLKVHFDRVRSLHRRDLRKGAGCVQLPYALRRKYPGMCRHWEWQWVFPSARISADPAPARCSASTRTRPASSAP